MATLPTRTLQELAEGVWVWLQPGGESGVSNAGVVADDDGLTVIDTLMVRSQWEPFANAVARLGGPVRLHELAAGHLLLDPAAAAWEHVRDLILSFVRP